MTSAKIGECKLCGEERPLQNSHIIPSFVFRWLKKTGGPMRLTTEPNRRVQDGLKEYWLCANCEQRFGKREKLFAENLFSQIEPKPNSLRYDDWFPYCATSLAWRTLEYAHGKTPEAPYSDRQLELLEIARNQWKDVLLERDKPSKKFQQHVVLFQAGKGPTGLDLPVNWNRFQLRHITLDIVGSSSQLMTYTKLGPFTFFGMIQFKAREWKGTRINNQGGVFPPQKVVMPKSILPLFHEKAALSSDAFDEVSPRQPETIKQTMANRLKNAEKDAHIQALIADYGMFGSQIFDNSSD